MEVYRELTGNILGWWMDHMIDPRGGFYGRMDGEGRMYEDSPKGAILNSRILWTFASAYRIATAERTRELFTDAQRQQYLDAATRARNYILDRFFAAFLSGCLACKWMIGLVRKGKLIYFGIYCFVVGSILIICNFV